MTPHRALNWLLATLIALGLSSAYLLDAPTEVQTRIHAAQSAHDAQVQAQRTERFERAARAMCGQNGAVALIDDSTIQCVSHQGKRGAVLSLAM